MAKYLFQVIDNLKTYQKWYFFSQFDDKVIEFSLF